MPLVYTVSIPSVDNLESFRLQAFVGTSPFVVRSVAETLEARPLAECWSVKSAALANATDLYHVLNVHTIIDMSATWTNLENRFRLFGCRIAIPAS